MAEHNAEQQAKVSGPASTGGTSRPNSEPRPPTSQATSPESDRDPVEVVINEFTERQRRGESPSIDEYVARYPDRADEIRELLDAATAMERLKVRKERTPGGQASLRGVQLERLGDFRIIREIGRGGMGIVYEAEQESLGRRVAVKVLPKQALLDEKHLRRFQREAQTAARLHHTNIVPVFGVGQHEDYHFYVMQLIDGNGLDRFGVTESGLGHREDTKVRRGDTVPEPINPSIALDGAAPAAHAPLVDLATQPADAHAVARIGIQAAEALNYAHQHGVLHRDVKPANLILDSEGTVWVTDFGLAKVLEQENVTRSGDVVGTLRYIAPEHLIGAQVDSRSDIYSLGITLYELLTGQPAFAGTSQARLIEQIVAGDIPRPRQINPDIPVDLETITLKTIACEPKDRYQSAGALAEDLRRFLDDKPLLARRTTAVEHAWRWYRRNRLTAALIATAASLLILLAVSPVVGYVQAKAALSRERDERERTKAALNRERDERERAEAATEVGLEVLDNIFERFAPPLFDPLGALIASGAESSGNEETSLRPALSPDTAALLESMLTFYDRLALQSGDNRRFRRKAAQANRRVGDIRQHLGQYDEAVAAYNRALDIYNQLDEADEGTDFALQRAQIYNQLGFAYPMMGQADDAKASLLKAKEIFESEVSDNSAPQIRYELAKTYYRLAGADRWNRVPPSGPRGATRDPRGWDAQPPQPDGPPGLHRPPAHPPRDPLRPPPQPDGILGPPELQRGPDTGHDISPDNAEQQEAYLRKAVSVLEELVGQPSCDPDHATFLACVHHALGTLHRHCDRWNDAVEDFRRAVSVQSDVVDRFPDSTSYNVVLGWLQQPLANALREQGELNEARRLLESSRDTLEWELAANPDRVYLHGLIAHAYFGLADVLLEFGQEKEADLAIRQADHYHRYMRRGAPYTQDRERDLDHERSPRPRPGIPPGPFGPPDAP